MLSMWICSYMLNSNHISKASIVNIIKNGCPIWATAAEKGEAPSDTEEAYKMLADVHNNCTRIAHLNALIVTRETAQDPANAKEMTAWHNAMTASSLSAADNEQIYPDEAKTHMFGSLLSALSWINNNIQNNPKNPMYIGDRIAFAIYIKDHHMSVCIAKIDDSPRQYAITLVDTLARDRVTGLRAEDSETACGVIVHLVNMKDLCTYIERLYPPVSDMGVLREGWKKQMKDIPPGARRDIQEYDNFLHSCTCYLFVLAPKK
jgi:hypothetical protein